MKFRPDDGADVPGAGIWHADQLHNGVRKREKKREKKKRRVHFQGGQWSITFIPPSLDGRGGGAWIPNPDAKPCVTHASLPNGLPRSTLFRGDRSSTSVSGSITRFRHWRGVGTGHALRIAPIVRGAGFPQQRLDGASRQHRSRDLPVTDCVPRTEPLAGNARQPRSGTT